MRRWMTAGESEQMTGCHWEIAACHGGMVSSRSCWAALLSAFLDVAGRAQQANDDRKQCPAYPQCTPITDSGLKMIFSPQVPVLTGISWPRCSRRDICGWDCDLPPPSPTAPGTPIGQRLATPQADDGLRTVGSQLGAGDTIRRVRLGAPQRIRPGLVEYLYSCPGAVTAENEAMSDSPPSRPGRAPLPRAMWLVCALAVAAARPARRDRPGGHRDGELGYSCAWLGMARGWRPRPTGPGRRRGGRARRGRSTPPLARQRRSDSRRDHRGGGRLVLADPHAGGLMTICHL